VSELGQLLKKARLERGISLEDLQETTKIRKKYLESIEEGNYKVLPGSFYVRAFIKSYAEAVGLDPTETLRLYRHDIPTPTEDPGAETLAPPKRTISKRSDKWSRWTTGIMLFSFFLLIVSLIYFFAYKNYNGDENRQVTEDQSPRLTEKTAVDSPAPTESPTPDAQAKAAAETPAPLKPEVKFVRTDEKGVDYFEVRNASKVSVEMSLIGRDCWFSIAKLTGSGENATSQGMEQGSMKNVTSPKIWEVEGPVYLTLGLPNAVQLTVNGVLIPLELPNPKRLQFELVPGA